MNKIPLRASDIVMLTASIVIVTIGWVLLFLSVIPLLSVPSVVTTATQSSAITFTCTSESSTATAHFDFVMTATPHIQTVAVGESAHYQLTIMGPSCIAGKPLVTNLTVAGLPPGTAASFSPSSGVPPFNSILTISASPALPPGDYSLTVSAQADGIIHTIILALRTPPAAPFMCVNPICSIRLFLHSYGGLIMLSIGVVAFGGAYVRIHDYRTRVHIYHEIIEYVAESPRIPSHIMRKCNLETSKFSKYISVLGERGFVQKISGDGDRYGATDKALDYLRDRKLSEFLKELH